MSERKGGNFLARFITTTSILICYAICSIVSYFVLYVADFEFAFSLSASIYIGLMFIFGIGIIVGAAASSLFLCRGKRDEGAHAS